MQVEVPELNQVLETLGRIEERLDALDNRRLKVRPHLTIKECAELKGIPYGTLRNNPLRRPRRGKPDLRVSGKPRWKWDTVMEWLEQGDADIR